MSSTPPRKLFRVLISLGRDKFGQERTAIVFMTEWELENARRHPDKKDKILDVMEAGTFPVYPV